MAETYNHDDIAVAAGVLGMDAEDLTAALSRTMQPARRPNLLSTAQFAKRAGLSRKTVLRNIHAGLIPAVRFGRRAIRIPESVLKTGVTSL